MDGANLSNAMDRIELEESSGLVPLADLRRRMDEPPPVKLISVDDVCLVTPPGMDDQLDHFYQAVLEFFAEPAVQGKIYRAENFRLRFEVVLDQKPIDRDGMRPQGIEVRSLRDMERKLFSHQINYTRERGLLPGLMTLLLKDPAGNWIELLESPRVG